MSVGSHGPELSSIIFALSTFGLSVSGTFTSHTNQCGVLFLHPVVCHSPHSQRNDSAPLAKTSATLPLSFCGDTNGSQGLVHAEDLTPFFLSLTKTLRKDLLQLLY